MSKARGASKMRKIKRAGFQNFNWETGQLIGRPFNNKSNKGKRKPTHKFTSPNMVVERDGKNVTVPMTVTKSYQRRVFPNADGHYPEGAVPAKMHEGGKPGTDEARYRDIMVITDTKEVKVTSTTRIEL